MASLRYFIIPKSDLDAKADPDESGEYDAQGICDCMVQYKKGTAVKNLYPDFGTEDKYKLKCNDLDFILSDHYPNGLEFNHTAMKIEGDKTEWKRAVPWEE